MNASPVASRPALAPFGSELGDPRPVAGSRPAHPRLDDPRDPVALEQQGHAGHVVLVGMGQHEQVDPAVPGRHVRVEGDEEAIRIGSAIDEHPRAAVRVDEDRVALPDVEDRDPDPPVRPVQGDGADADDDDRQPRPTIARSAGDVGVGRGRGRLSRLGRRSPRRRCSRRGVTLRRRRRPTVDGAIAEPQPEAPGALERHDERPRPPATAAARRLSGGASVALAKGRAAAARTITIIAESAAHAGQAEDRRQRARRTGGRGCAADERHAAGGHRRGDDRHDQQVHERRDDRHPAEPGEGDRQRRELGGERDPERLAQPARQPAAAPALEALRERRRPRDEPAGRGGREGEARVRDERRGGDEQARRWPSRARPRPARSGPSRGPAGRPRP